MLAGRLGPERAAWVVRALTPTNPADRPGGTPAFPDLGDPTAIARTPLVRLLPDRWVATAYAGGPAVAVGIGRDIQRDLAIGPDLDADVTIDDEAPAVDEGMRWMVDFDRAEDVGMALRLTLPTPQVDVLLVLGTSEGDRSDDLAAQLDAHHYADGLAFLPAGSPTNNTEAGRTPYQAPDPQFDRSFDEELLAGDPAPGSYAARAEAAFGVPAFRHASAAAQQDEPTARAMARALWPATWGYFLTQMIGFDGTGLTPAGQEWARAHATEHVRRGGPLPVLRIGRQPYGVLPVTSLDRWTDEGADDSFRDLLVRLRDAVWRSATFSAPRVGRSDDASVDLATVLEARGLSSSYRVRNTMGQHFLQHLHPFLGEDLPFFIWRNLVELTTQQTRRVGLEFVPALAHAAHEGVARPITGPLVGEPSYVADLLAVTDPETLVALSDEAQPLLQVLLRHGLLREYAEASARALDAADPRLLRDTELVDLVPGTQPTPTWSWTRRQPVGGGTAADLAGEDRALAEFREALGTLATADVPALERHLAETLDAASHRLDAWVTSLATRRLAELREAQPTGLRVGGYGWVENLRPATPGPEVTDVPDEPGPLVAPADDPGFIHAPSLNQASAAALLRNAHLSHGGEEASPYAIELTSARVRLAKQLFEGVRQGQPIGALLGYTFERNLHDAQLDDLIDDFRAIAPLPGASTPTGVRRLVVDGLALAKKWQEDPDAVLAPSDPRHERAQKVLDALEAAVDAAADALNAEGAFQMVRGNLARAATSLDAVSSGQVAAARPRLRAYAAHRHRPHPPGRPVRRCRCPTEPLRVGTPIHLSARERRPGPRRLGGRAARTRRRGCRPRRGGLRRRRGDGHPPGHPRLAGADADRPGLGDRRCRRAATGGRGAAARGGRGHREGGPVPRGRWPGRARRGRHPGAAAAGRCATARRCRPAATARRTGAWPGPRRVREPGGAGGAVPPGGPRRSPAGDRRRHRRACGDARRRGVRCPGSGAGARDRRRDVAGPGRAGRPVAPTRRSAARGGCARPAARTVACGLRLGVPRAAPVHGCQRRRGRRLA